MESAQTGFTILIGEDTDLLILLLYHFQDSMYNILFRSDVKRPHSVQPNRIYNIRLLQRSMEKDVVNSMLFLHAFTGCDSTSRIHSVGKKKIFHKILEDAHFRCQALSFTRDGLTQNSVEELGRNAMLAIFDGKTNETLTACRHRHFVAKVTSASSFVKPERLPPTESATKFHSLRSYYQISVWKGTDSNLQATDWGWKLHDGHYEPLTMDCSPAPETLLKMMRCNCTTGCISKRCGCRKNGFHCNLSCGKCQETVCEDEPSADNMEDDIDNDIDGIFDDIV